MLKKLKKDIDAELASFLKNAANKLDLKGSSALLYSGIKNFIERSGKRIRPILLLISYQGYTKRKTFSYKKLLRCSLSLELLHDFLLVHDDIIDRSSIRRGEPTLHKLFNAKLNMPAENNLGSNLGIVAGDVIFALAISALLSFNEKSSRKEQALLEFSKTAAQAGMGEFADVMNDIKKIEKITEKDILRTYTLKTAKYTFECPLLIGAMLAGADKKEQKKLSGLGLVLGQAFQIQDDLLDMFSSSKKIGKPVLSDLNESKKTLLMWKTYKNLSGKDKKLLEQLLEKDKKTYSDLLEVRGLVKTAEAGRHCLEKIRSLLQKAETILAGARMKKEYKAVLKHLVQELFLTRDSLKL
jgi:geranylgeranyl diphosphate synthase type I